MLPSGVNYGTQVRVTGNIQGTRLSTEQAEKSPSSRCIPETSLGSQLLFPSWLSATHRLISPVRLFPQRLPLYWRAECASPATHHAVCPWAGLSPTLSTAARPGSRSPLRNSTATGWRRQRQLSLFYFLTRWKQNSTIFKRYHSPPSLPPKNHFILDLLFLLIGWV